MGQIKNIKLHIVTDIKKNNKQRMAQKRPDIFQWNRRLAPQTPQRTKKKKDPVQSWIQRVQDASEEAAEEVLGGAGGGVDEFLRGEVIVPDDEAVYEAQQLVDGWMKESSMPHLHNELDYQHEPWTSTTGVLGGDDYLNSGGGFGREGNSDSLLDQLTRKYLVENNVEPVKLKDHSTCGNSVADALDSHPYVSSYLDNDDIDDTLLVQDVLHGMLSKDFTKNIDLGLKPLEAVAKNPVP